MDLNERKIRILEYIINDYIASAEPVGSRTIARKYDMGLSSATIRNEMSDLEDMGYIIAPHASAGRVPSDKGYRLYVDRLLKRRGRGDAEAETEEILYLRRLITNNINQIDHLMQETAKAVSMLTSYTTVVSEAVSGAESLHHLQLLPLDEVSVALVTVTDSKKIKNHVIRVNVDMDYEELSRLSRVLNAVLAGQGLDSVTPAMVRALEEGFRGHGPLLSAVLTAVAEVLNDGRRQSVYTSGIKNILAYPEFSDLDKAKAFFNTLEERDCLVMLMDRIEEGVSVIIGQENSIAELQGCSIVRANYSLDPSGRVHGTVAVIGPTRMEYTQALAVLQGIVRNINGAIKSLGG